MVNLGPKLLQNIEGMQKQVLYYISLCIHKVYDALEWGGGLAILEGCGLGDQLFQLLTLYWYRSTMVVRVSG